MIAQHAEEERLMGLLPVTTESNGQEAEPDSQIVRLIPLSEPTNFQDFGYEMGPVFWPPINTSWIEWIYTIDLDRNLFSVGSHDSRGHDHFKLDDIPEDWMELLERAWTTEASLNQSAASYPRPVPDQDLLELYKRSKPTTFQISPESPFIHEPTYMRLIDCLTSQLSDDTSYDYFKLLDEWGPNDPQFKQLAFTMLHLSSSCAIDDHRIIPQPIQFECTYPSTSSFWFNGVYILFETHLDHSWSPQNLKAAVAKSISAKGNPSGESFTALIFSIRHVVVVEVDSDGTVKHTLPIPVIDKLRQPSPPGEPPRYSSFGFRAIPVVLCRSLAATRPVTETRLEVEVRPKQEIKQDS